MVIWLTGLSGAGKTTIGRELYALLKKREYSLFIDGDDIRLVVGDNLGYDPESRKINAWRICRLCQYIERQGINVICSTISMFEEIQEWNRANFNHYFEVFIEAPMEELLLRDTKGLYKQSADGKLKNVVGVDIQHMAPRNPELIIKNAMPFVNPKEIATSILNKIYGY